MANIKKITLPSGTTYDIVDQGARDLIDEMSGYTDFLGVTTTALTDGATTNPIKINNVDVTAKKGNIVTYGSAEFIFNGTAWQAFGDLSGLGDLAFKDSVSATYTPAGTVSKPTFTGTEGNVSVSGSVLNSIGVQMSDTAVSEAYFNFTPSGTVSQPTFSGTKVYAHHTFTGTANTSTGNFTPAGSVSAPTISVKTAGGTTTIKNPTSKTVVTDMSVQNPSSTQVSGELVYCSVANETLSLSKFVETTGASITTANVTVKNGDAAYEATAPTFTGTQGSVSVSGTAKGSVTTTYNSTSTGASGNFTPAGTVSQPTFSGNGKYVKFEVEMGERTMTGKFTPAGSVSQPTFTGTQATIESD